MVHYLLCSFLLFLTKSQSAKYGLALINHLIDIFGSNLAIGYEIRCVFSKTVTASHLVGAKAQAAALHLLVPSFHGHAHNWWCQLFWHPLFIYDAGLEDFKTCEHVFSSSSHIVSTMQCATKFHHHQAIEEHFMFWDKDKYANLSMCLG